MDSARPGKNLLRSLNGTGGLILGGTRLMLNNSSRVLTKVSGSNGGGSGVEDVSAFCVVVLADDFEEDFEGFSSSL